MLRIKLLTVTSLAAIAPGISHLHVTPAANMGPANVDATQATIEVADVQSVAMDAAREHQVDPAIVLSVLEIESIFDQYAVSPKGALGLMQVMPETARELGFNPKNWRENIRAGTVYLGLLMSRYRGHRNRLELALAAYNAGPAAVDRYQGIPPYRETRTYVKRVMSRYRSQLLSVAGPQPVLVSD